MDYNDEPDSDPHDHQGPQISTSQSPEHMNEDEDDIDELDDDTDKSPAQILRETIAECPSAFGKFRLVSPEIAAKQAKKQTAAEKRKQTAARKREEKREAATASQKRKIEHVEANNENESNNVHKASKNKKKKVENADINDVSSDGEQQNERKVKKGKGRATVKADSDSEEFEDIVTITAYIFVERPVTNAPTRTAASSRAHKPTDDEKYMDRGVIMFSSTITFQDFLSAIAEKLPCNVDEVVHDKIRWRFQTPARGTYLSLGGEVGHKSMIVQAKEKRAGARVIMLAMPPPRRPIVEQPFWDDTSQKAFDYTELEAVSTHDHVVEQRVSFDKSVGPHRDALLARYLLDNNPLFPGKRIYTNVKMQCYFELTDMRINVWASHLARGTATLELPPISSHFDYKARILPSPTPNTGATPVTSQPPSQQATPAAAVNAESNKGTTTTLMDIMLFNMIQQQQQQQLHYQNTMQTMTGFPITTGPTASASAVAATPTINQHPSVSFAPQSPAKFQLPDVALAAFCQRYNVNSTDQERLEKLEFHPGDKIDNLSEDDWKVFAGFTSLSWQRVVEKNHTFVRDARNGLWAPTA